MFCPKDKFSMHKTLIYVVLRISYPCTRHSFMFCPKDKFSMHLCMDDLSLGQDINECLVHGEFALRTEHK
jgi:hypothetical protein